MKYFFFLFYCISALSSVNGNYYYTALITLTTAGFSDFPIISIVIRKATAAPSCIC